MFWGLYEGFRPEVAEEVESPNLDPISCPTQVDFVHHASPTYNTSMPASFLPFPSRPLQTIFAES